MLSPKSLLHCKCVAQTMGQRTKATLAPALTETALTEAVCPALRTDYVQDTQPGMIASSGSETCSDAKSFDEIPGPRGLPFIGNALKYTRLGREESTRSTPYCIRLSPRHATFSSPSSQSGWPSLASLYICADMASKAEYISFKLENVVDLEWTLRA